MAARKRRRNTRRTKRRPVRLQVGVQLTPEEHGQLLAAASTLRQITGKNVYLAEVARAALMRGLPRLRSDIQQIEEEYTKPQQRPGLE